MYKAKFVSGENVFWLGTENNLVFDISDLSGNDIELGLSQGVSQIGQTVDRMSIGGSTLTIKGVIYDDVQNGKMALRHAFAPFKEGTLYFDEYYIYVVVRHSPTFSPKKDNGSFQLQLFAPYPFWRSVANNVTTLSTGSTETNVVNNGDIEVPYSVKIYSDSTSTDVTITNTGTGEKLALVGAINSGDTIEIYRDKNNIIRAEKTASGTTTDAISMIDEDSDLWTVHVGDNVYTATDDEGGSDLHVIIEYNEAVGGVYEY